MFVYVNVIMHALVCFSYLINSGNGQFAWNKPQGDRQHFVTGSIVTQEVTNQIEKYFQYTIMLSCRRVYHTLL